MQRDKPPRESQFSDSDRARLDELLEDAEFERKLAERNRKRWEGIKTWATWLITIVAALSIIKDAAAALLGHLLEWMGGR